MVDNKHDEDMYQFPEEEVGADQSVDSATADGDRHAEQGAEEPKAGAPKPLDKFVVWFKAQWKKNPKLVVIVIVVVFALLFMKVFHRDNNDQMNLNQPSAQQVTAENNAALAQQNQLKLMQASKAQNQAVSGQLNKLQTIAESNQQAISQLEGQVQSLQDKVTSLNKMQQQLTAALINVSDEVRQMRAELKPKGHHAAKPVKITYRLRAIVPGRAWVMSSQGHPMTVSVGDQLAQYGRVTKILPDSGEVLTSDGKVITYNEVAN